MEEEKKNVLMGYPSVDQPWLKYYPMTNGWESNIAEGSYSFSKKLYKPKKARMSRGAVLADIYANHNHSWFEELQERNRGNLEKTAISYWDIDISYKCFFELALMYAKALRSIGIGKGDEFVACVRQCPDYPAIVAAASYIGACVDLISPEFNPDFISDIIVKSGRKLILVSDWDLAKISPAIEKSDVGLCVTVPLARWGGDPHRDISEKFFKFDIQSYLASKNRLKTVESIEEFLHRGYAYSGEINGHGHLEDTIAVTYSSGSTKKGYHKGIPQCNRVFIIMGRYHDPEVTGMPKMSETRTYAAIGTQADTILMTGVSDTLMEGGIVVLDPVVDSRYFLYSMMFYKAGLVIATRSSWLEALYQYRINPDFRGLKLPYLYVPSEGGEPLSAGEEYALNRWLCEVKAGTAITKTPFSIVKMSVGGGDSEHGSIFLTLFRGYYSVLQKIRGIHEPIGMGYYDFADVSVLREDGTHCAPMEPGRLVANSPLSMNMYHNDPLSTERFFICDSEGNQWGDLGCYGYIDKWNYVYVKGRLSATASDIPLSQIADIMQQDYKHILSCEVVYCVYNDKPIYIAHIEMQHDCKPGKTNYYLKKAAELCIKNYGQNFAGQLYFRVHESDDRFKLLFTTKRDIHSLNAEGLSEKCFSALDLFI